jgi:hypothetical protein
VSRQDVTRTEITITTPAGEQIVLGKDYLPKNPSPLTITCADLTISGAGSPANTTDNDCGCGAVSSDSATAFNTSCFSDGCWVFKYDVYATESVGTYSWNISGMVTPSYCTSIVIDGDTHYSTTPLSSPSEVLDWLNTLSLGYFTMDTATNIVTVSSYTHTYGNIGFSDEQVAYQFDFTACSSFSFPATLVSVTIGVTVYTINVSVSSWTDVVSAINNVGVGVYSSGGFVPVPSTGILLVDSCGTADITALEFTGCLPDVTKISPSATSVVPTISSANTETLVGSVTESVFLYCNIRNEINSFKLSQYASDCDCTPDIQGKICMLDSDFDTMVIASQNKTSCDCVCATNYLNKVRNNLAALQKICP